MKKNKELSNEEFRGIKVANKSLYLFNGAEAGDGRNINGPTPELKPLEIFDKYYCEQNAFQFKPLTSFYYLNPSRGCKRKICSKSYISEKGPLRTCLYSYFFSLLFSLHC